MDTRQIVDEVVEAIGHDSAMALAQAIQQNPNYISNTLKEHAEMALNADLFDRIAAALGPVTLEKLIIAWSSLRHSGIVNNLDAAFRRNFPSRYDDWESEKEERNGE